MSKSQPSISVLTANRLSDGAVVFLDFDGVWADNLRGAVVARSPDEARALESRGAYDAARNIVVEPYLVEMHEGGDGSLTPVRFRERVRLGGPSILGDVPGYTEVVPSAAPRPDPLPMHGQREKRVEAA